MKHKTRISAPNGLAAAAILIAAFGFVGVGSTAGAASMSQASPHASPWVEVADSSRIRIVRGATRPTGVIEAGIQIQLDPGWKTYWRYPGDAGVPPQFDWSASNNVAAIDVLWPVPEHFRDDYGDNIGYHDEVVFPLVITPEVDGRPVNLDMTVYFAVCKDICIPARADLALAFGEQTSTPRYAFLIAQFVDATPKPPEDVEGLAVAAVEPLATDAGVALVVDVLSRDRDRPTDLFVTGPAHLFFGRPRDHAGAPAGHKRFLVPVSGASSADELSDLELEFVVAEGDKRLAQTWRFP